MHIRKHITAMGIAGRRYFTGVNLSMKVPINARAPEVFLVVFELLVFRALTFG
jgi:hypothetical protein